MLSIKVAVFVSNMTSAFHPNVSIVKQPETRTDQRQRPNVKIPQCIKDRTLRFDALIWLR